jgi:hypothetical protein
MKYLIILIMITHSFAGSLFWENVDKIEKEFYQTVFEINDKNTTYSSENVSTALDQKYNSFNEC